MVDDVVLRPIGIDDWSDVRYVHAASFRMLGGSQSSRSVVAFNAMVAQPEYVDRMREAHLIGAWIGRELVGTAGWLPADDRGMTARITGHFVRPLFTMLGIGSLLLSRAEQDARDAGFSRFTARATGAVVPFYAAHDYEISSYGSQAIDGLREIKLVFMRKADAAARIVPITSVSRETSEVRLVFDRLPSQAAL